MRVWFEDNISISYHNCYDHRHNLPWMLSHDPDSSFSSRYWDLGNCFGDCDGHFSSGLDNIEGCFPDDGGDCVREVCHVFYCGGRETEYAGYVGLEVAGSGEGVAWVEGVRSSVYNRIEICNWIAMVHDSEFLTMPWISWARPNTPYLSPLPPRPLTPQPHQSLHPAPLRPSRPVQPHSHLLKIASAACLHLGCS